jgi:hypothetical protein
VATIPSSVAGAADRPRCKCGHPDARAGPIDDDVALHRLAATAACRAGDRSASFPIVERHVQPVTLASAACDAAGQGSEHRMASTLISTIRR